VTSRRRSWPRVVSPVSFGLALSLLACPTALHAQCIDESARVTVSVHITLAKSYHSPDPEGIFGGDPELFAKVTFTDTAGDDAGFSCVPPDVPSPGGRGSAYSVKPPLPGWTFTCTVDPSEAVDVKVELYDYDDGLAGPDEHIDISSVDGERDLKFTYDPWCNRVFDAEGNPGAIPNCSRDDHSDKSCSGATKQKPGAGNGEGAGYRGRIEFSMEANGGCSPRNDDLYLGRLETIQVTPNPDAIVEDKPTMVRLAICSTYTDPKEVLVRVRATDKAGNVFLEDKTVSVPGCGNSDVNMFQGACPVPVGVPAFQPQDGILNFMQVDAEIDPNHIVDCPPGPAGGCDLADCKIQNNGAADRTMRIKETRPLRVLYQPFTGALVCAIQWGDGDLAEAVQAAADPFLLDIYPITSVDSQATDEPFPLHGLGGPVSCAHPALVENDIVGAILGTKIVGVVRALPSFFDCEYIVPACAAAVGASGGRFAPHMVLTQHTFASAELVAHEIGHTLNLSESPCPLGFPESIFGCEDEYQWCPGPVGYCNAVEGRDDGVRSSGFNVRTCESMDDTACVMGGSGEGSPTHWIDGTDYDHLIDKLKLDPDPEVLWFRLNLTRCGGGSFYDDDPSRMPGLPEYVSESAGGRVYTDETTSLVFQDAAGATLDRVSFTPEIIDSGGDADFVDDGFGHPDRFERLDSIDMALLVPLPPGTDQILLARRQPPGGCGGDGEFDIVDTLDVPAELVDIELAHPLSSVFVDPGDMVPIAWRNVVVAGEALGAARPRLSYVFVSPDNGVSWVPVASRVTGNETIWQAHSRGRFLVRVFTTNGFNTDDEQGESDVDGDGCGDSRDPSPTVPDPDSDGDGVADVCDNCVAVPNPVQENADSDPLGNACDNCPLVTNPTQADADQDARGDACDCAPSDPAAWSGPGEVTGVRADRSPQGPSYVTLSWDALAGQAGPGVVYDVITGTFSSLRVNRGFTEFECLATDEPGTSIVKIQPQPEPPLPNGYWYLVRGQNACGHGTWGDGSGTPDPRDPLESGAPCVPPAPVLNISKTDSPDPVVAGSNLTYSLSFSNTGNAAATGVVITDVVPANTTFVSATGGGMLGTGGVVSWSIGTLAAGATGSVQMVVRVASPLPNGTLISNGTYSIGSNETATATGPPVTTTVITLPVLAIDLDVSTPTVVDSSRVLSPTTTSLDVGIILDARGSNGIGDVARVPFGIINAFNLGGATVTGITLLGIVDVMPPSTPPNNATFSSLTGEFEFGAALTERGVPSNAFGGGPVQYARFRVTFGNRPTGSSIRVFIGDRGSGSQSIRSGQGIDISGDATPDGTPVLGMPGSDEGTGAGVDYQDGVVRF